MKVVVLGAGVTGVAAAWYLQQAGHEVTVIDRQAQAGMETSFANGGQISVSHAEPWANPQAPRKIWKWLGKEDAPLLFRFRADLHQWLWGLAFLRECTHARTHHNIQQIVALGLYSRASLQQLRADTGIEYDALTRGILHFYTSEQEFAEAQEPAQVMRDHGCDLVMKTADECVAIEPALAPVRHLIAGASMTASDESGDAYKFTQELAKRCEAGGATFRYGMDILGLRSEGGRIAGVVIEREDGGKSTRETVVADSYVVCMGSYSPRLLGPLGEHIAVYPAKGYSLTLPIVDAARAPTVSLTDDEHKLVFSRLGDRLRVAGTAELNGYNLDLNEVRCQALLKRTLELFPGVGDAAQAQFWTGLRPATPSNLPYVGKTRFDNLFLDTGHGTLGWTLACGSGRAIADIVSGRKPEVSFAFRGLA